jgi:hypothetical protein
LAVGVLETAQPLATLAQAKFSSAKLEADGPLMQKYASEGLLGLDPIALAHQLCLIDLGMLKEIRSVFFPLFHCPANMRPKRLPLLLHRAHELMRTNWLKKDKVILNIVLLLIAVQSSKIVTFVRRMLSQSTSSTSSSGSTSSAAGS